MAETTSANRWIVPVAIALIALLAGGLAGWWLRSAEVAELEERLAEAEAAATVEPSEHDAGDEVPSPPTAPSEDEPAAPERTGESDVSGREFCFVAGIEIVDGTVFVTVDYARFLSGDEAAAEAAARGDESPPPNDFYIVNDNSLLRRFPVSADASVRLVTLTTGVDPEGYDSTVDEWHSNFSAIPTARAVPYWITLEEGVVVAIEEQYLP